MNEKLKDLRKKAMALPLSPGVYIMKNKRGEIIYIGKAKQLKNRVSQYFGSQNNHPPKVRKMVENVSDFDYILTDSEFEALVLECSLIKQNRPKYNILLKDDKGYSYVKITPNPWGNIFAVYRKDDENASYLGPYTGGFSVSNAVDEAKEIFKLPTCKKVFPRDIGKERPCLNFFIGKCSAPCGGKISEKEYEANLEEAIRFIKSGRGEAVKRLEEMMTAAAERLDFEKAAELRDKLRSIERIKNRQKVVTSETTNRDVFAVAQSTEKSCLSVMNFREGLLTNTSFFIVDANPDLPEMRNELLTSYYISGREIPPKILVDGEVEGSDVLLEWLFEKRGKKVELSVPQRGEGLELVRMALNNAGRHLGDYLGRKGNETAALDELAKALGLSKVPSVIESYDISHTAGADNVCGMVVFKDGRPFKKGYKKFTIKSFDGQDDYGSLREAVFRRLNRFAEGDESFAPLPDLILLDGGEGQVNAVKPVVEAFGFDIPVFGMVKDGKHRTRAIAYDGGEIHIQDGRRLFTLVSNIQEEVHRFAITFHKEKHAGRSLQLRLTEIPGIGEKKAKILLKEFKSLKKIKEASEEELASVKGISKSDAKAIREAFKSKE